MGKNSDFGGAHAVLNLNKFSLTFNLKSSKSKVIFQHLAKMLIWYWKNSCLELWKSLEWDKRSTTTLYIALPESWPWYHLSGFQLSVCEGVDEDIMEKPFFFSWTCRPQLLIIVKNILKIAGNRSKIYWIIFKYCTKN